MSMPISRSASTACGRTDVGSEPAEDTFTSGGARLRAMPSAIWLLAEFATHRKRMCRGPSSLRCSVSATHDCDVAKRDPPLEGGGRPALKDVGELSLGERRGRFIGALHAVTP